MLNFPDVTYICTLPKKKSLRVAVGELKSRLYNHKLSFKHKRYSNKTALSSYKWHLKSVSSETRYLRLSLLRYVPTCSNISKKCLLCWYEKLKIVTYQNQKKLLNKRSELLCKSGYANKFLFKGLHWSLQTHSTLKGRGIHVVPL